MSETERLRIAIMAYRDICEAMAHVNSHRICEVGEPSDITVDGQTFTWSFIGHALEKSKNWN